MEKKLLEAFAGLGKSVVAALPKVAVGILLVILGLVAAKLVEVVLRAVLVRIRFDTLIGKAGVDKTLQRIGLRQPLTLFLPKLAYFLVIIVLAQTASDKENKDVYAKIDAELRKRLNIGVAKAEVPEVPAGGHAEAKDAVRPRKAN